MEVFLIVRRKKSSIFLDCSENTQVLTFKKMIQGITNVPPENLQFLTQEGVILDDDKTLSDYQINPTVARAQAPFELRLVYREPNGEFEAPDVTPLSSPPDLPEVMKPRDSQREQ
ncbi:elongin-B-like [Artemia franciscana]|uniref:Ubiquitin-like domain-containing protein n=1 Tax=Artemia franciscana TaxID=6661 RepID=A0AA88IT78_ARTSF|nr:hypothetical protein QYM36_000722 [Artemia franciscana]